MGYNWKEYNETTEAIMQRYSHEDLARLIATVAGEIGVERPLNKDFRFTNAIARVVRENTSAAKKYWKFHKAVNEFLKQT